MLMPFCFAFAEYIHTASDPRNMQVPICTSKKNRNFKWDNCLIAQAGKQWKASPGCSFIGLDQVMSTSISTSSTGLFDEFFLQYPRLNYTSIDMSQAASSLISHCEITSEVLVQTER